MIALVGKPLRCSVCKSIDCAMTLNRSPNVVVCLNCKHEEDPKVVKPHPPTGASKKDYQPEF